MKTDPAHQTPAKEKAAEPLPLTTGSAFDRWCRQLGWQFIKTAMEAMEKDAKPSDKDLADIVRNACNDYVSDKVMLDNAEVARTEGEKRS